MQAIEKPVTRITSKARHCVCEPVIKEVGSAKEVVLTLEPVIRYFRAEATDGVQNELIFFNPEIEGLPKSGKVFLQIDQQLYELEINLRMLQPAELALAQGFRKGYSFTGTKTGSG